MDTMGIRGRAGIMEKTRGERRIQIRKKATHIVGCIFNKGISARFTLERARLVEQVVELGDLPELGEDLEQRVPGAC